MLDFKLEDEPGRLAALHRYEMLDTLPEQPFDRITGLIKTLLNVPISVISLVDAQRQWFKSCIGLDVQETGRDISFCNHTIRSRKPMVVPDARCDPRFAENPLVLGDPYIASYAGIPLETPDGYNVGSLCVIDTVPRCFDEKQIALLKSFAAIVMNEFELRRLAQVDQLTGATSRRGFLNEAARAISMFSRYKNMSALVMFDIDHFKHVNDTYGHAAGDAVLKALGVCFADLTRPSDVFARLGGEEFAILLNVAKFSDAVTAAERFRKAIENLVVAYDPPLRVTASFGVAALGDDCQTPEYWLSKADEALYQAKRSGRNRCCEAPEIELAQG